MRCVGLDGRDYHWDWPVNERNPDKECSTHHEQARTLLQRVYPLDRILEEVYLPGSNGLTADFYLPHRKLLVEVHGRQHYEYVHHFHGNYLEFLAGKKRDANKRLWCNMNQITYLELPYDRTGEWEDLLRASFAR